MKFLCVPCAEAMRLVHAGSPDDAGSLTVVFACPRCEHSTAMLTNAGETQMVRSLGVRIGPAGEPAEPLAHLKANLHRARAALQTDEGTVEPAWTPAALQRLHAAPSFVQAMIHETYTDYARQHGMREITPAVMDAARQALDMGSPRGEQ